MMSQAVMDADAAELEDFYIGMADTTGPLPPAISSSDCDEETQGVAASNVRMAESRGIWGGDWRSEGIEKDLREAGTAGGMNGTGRSGGAEEEGGLRGCVCVCVCGGGGGGGGGKVGRHGVLGWAV